MPTDNANVEIVSLPKRSLWQFSLWKLLGLVTAVSIWCAIASWSLAWAIVWGVAALYLAALIICDQKKSFTLGAWILTLCPAGFVLYYMPAFLREDSALYEGTITLEVTIKDAITREPLANIPIEWRADGDGITDNTNSTGKSRITASFPGQKRSLGWGRSRYELHLSGVSMFIAAPGYEATFVDWVQHTRKQKVVWDESRLLETEVFIKPETTAPDAEPTELDSL